MTRYHFSIAAMTLAVLASVFPLERVVGCPFCSAVALTFSEEMKSMDVVVLATLIKPAKISELNTADPNAPVPKSVFRIDQILQGDKFIKVGDTLEVIYFGEPATGKSYLAMATDAPRLTWNTPLVLSDRAKEYLPKLHTLPATPERLQFFQEYLEDSDETLARDAFDEFAKAPYADVISLKEHMQRDRLLTFIQNPKVPSNRRRLYFTMLGICGKPEDAELLEKLLLSKDREARQGLDALLACYLLLKPEGLELVETTYLKNTKSEYADTYATIQALRFHLSEVSVIPKERAIKALRLMLDRPELADLVIPDLAKWEDWDALPRLVQLFREADQESSWVRVPVINFLRVCPLPEAKDAITQLEKLDPEAVKRAMTFLPLPADGGKDQPDPPESTPAITPIPVQPKPADASQLSYPASLYVNSTYVPGDELVADTRMTDAASVPTDTTAAPKTEKVSTRTDRASSLGLHIAPASIEQAEAQSNRGVNPWLMIGVALCSGGCCFVAMKSMIACRE